MSESAEMKLATGEWKPMKVPTLDAKPTIAQERSVTVRRRSLADGPPTVAAATIGADESSR